MGTGERPARALADRVDRAGREPDPEQLMCELGDVAARDPVTRRQRHDRGLQVRPERRCADAIRHGGRGLGVALRAAQPVRAMLEHDHAGRRQLGHLAAAEPAPGLALVDAELVAAAATGIRVVIDDLIDLIFGLQRPTRAPMPSLTARFALGALPPQQLLRLCARLGPPLLTRLGWILRRRFRTRPRVLPHLTLQPSQPLLKPLNPSGEIEHELHAHIPAGVIDRLGLGTLHGAKIRRAQPRTLLWRPTTERLPEAPRLQGFLGMGAAGFEPATSRV